MRSAVVSGVAEIDWSHPWFGAWRRRGEPLAHHAMEVGLVQALNARLTDEMQLRAGPLQFIAQSALPAGEAYETFIGRTACVPTRDNLHDFFNGLVWLTHPRLKRRLNELQAGALAQATPGAPRSRVRDTLTLFDENAALLQAPQALVDALRRRDWRGLFITQRSAWAQARISLIGHALLEKLNRPRKAITAHVWVSLQPLASQACAADQMAESITAQALLGKPYLPLPLLGVPGWWAENEAPEFYSDAAVFRPRKHENSGREAAV